MRKFVLFAVAGSLLVCGCQRQAQPESTPAQAAPKAPAAAFVSQPGFEAAGYYLPLTPIQVGNFKLAHLSIGAPSDFSQWQDGKREGVFGPIIIQFWDVTSPGEVTEQGQMGFTTHASVLPESYVFEPGRFEFTGSEAHVGKVSFSGRFDTAAMERVRGQADETIPVLVGTLKVGDQTNENVRFGFWVGD